jgi:gluconate kinase
MSQVVIISGPSGAGKSSTAEALCERYDRTVHLETDALFRWIRMGYVDPMKPASDRQNRMVARASARAATAYAEELFAVFIDGVIGPELLPVYLAELRPARVAVHFLVLLPSLDETLRRIVQRDPSHNMPQESHRALYAQFAEHGRFAGVLIDNTGLESRETADRVMDACGRGAALVQTAG